VFGGFASADSLTVLRREEGGMLHHSNAGILFAVTVVLASYATCSAIGPADTAFAGPPAPTQASSVRFIEIPSTMTEDEAMNPAPASRLQLSERVRQEITAMRENAGIVPDQAQKIDAIIVYTKNGIPILPDSQNARQKTLSSSDTNELSFSFSCPDNPWSSEELTTLQGWLSDFYPIVKAIYGSPAFSISVNICEDPDIGFAGLYYASTNEMILHDLDVDVTVHEMIHAFHDEYLRGRYDQSR
jgi:hypothetical protein